jgi:hypothetical protein
MSLNDDFDDLMASKERMEKRAFDFTALNTMADLWTKTYLVQHALGQTAMHNAPGLLHVGLHNGEVGKKLGHQSDGLARTLFGRSGMAPHDHGLLLGKEIRTQGLNASSRDDYLHEYIHNERSKDQLLHEQMMDEGKGKKFRPNIMPTILERSLEGEGDTKLSRFLLRHSIPEDAKKNWLQKTMHYGYSGLGATVDKRIIIRPLLEGNKDTKIVKGFENVMQKNKVTKAIRNYID